MPWRANSINWTVVRWCRHDLQCAEVVHGDGSGVIRRMSPPIWCVLLHRTTFFLFPVSITFSFVYGFCVTCTTSCVLVWDTCYMFWHWWHQREFCNDIWMNPCQFDNSWAVKRGTAIAWFLWISKLFWRSLLLGFLRKQTRSWWLTFIVLASGGGEAQRACGRTTWKSLETPRGDGCGKCTKKIGERMSGAGAHCWGGIRQALAHSRVLVLGSRPTEKTSSFTQTRNQIGDHKARVFAVCTWYFRQCGSWNSCEYSGLQMMENHVQLMRGEQGCVIRWTIIRKGHAHSWASSEISPFRNGGMEKPSQFINDVGRGWIFSCRNAQKMWSPVCDGGMSWFSQRECDQCTWTSWCMLNIDELE